MPGIHTRDYSPVLDAARDAAAHSQWATREAAMRGVCDLLWDHFGDPGPHRSGRGYSWVGFYIGGPGADEMTLAVRRDKPACSPIGLHGMCGRAWQTRRPIIIDDVATLGENYVACDPRDRSELVLPCLDANASAWGVFDADSWDLRAFDEADAAAVGELLCIAGLSSPQSQSPVRL
ncbi:MAG: GAF domain-containing protein [Phycisphaerales bacterium]